MAHLKTAKCGKNVDFWAVVCFMLRRKSPSDSIEITLVYSGVYGCLIEIISKIFTPLCFINSKMYKATLRVAFIDWRKKRL